MSEDIVSTLHESVRFTFEASVEQEIMDYDIDKAYMMGMSFNGIGKYVGWSSLFDYSSVQALKESEYLPMPNKTDFVKDDVSGTNIDKFVSTIDAAVKAGNRAQRVRAYADLLTFLNDNNITEVTWKIKTQEDIMKNLRDHEYTVIPKNMLEMASKNFISSHIQNTVQNFTNMIGAYSPIEMEDFRGASTNSPKGEQSKRMTLMNPATKYLMQYQNITGKNVIGIAATGIKGAFTWHYYMNEILQNNVNGSNEELIQRARFAFETSRINGRTEATLNFSTGTLKPDYNGHSVIKAIPDICWDKVSKETKRLLFEEGTLDDNVLIGKLTVDLLQSQVLSAATDNAKELILAKVNAGSKLAKCYLFLITMGFDINDIVSFMTSPVVSFIDRVTESNIYQGGNLGIEDAIDLLNGKIPTKLVHKFMDKKRASNFSNSQNLKKKIADAFIANILDTIEVGEKDYQLIDYISELQQIRSLMPEINEDAKADIAEFQHILEGSNEFSNFGRLLGINQGIKTTEQEFKSYLQFIQNIVASREKALGLDNMDEGKLREAGYDPELVGKFDVQRWLSDQDYKETIKEYYSNKLKVALPIFDMIDNIPQFRDSFKLVNAVNVINSAISLKTKVQDLIFSQYEPGSWSDNFKKNLLHSIHAKFIQQFLQNSGLKLPYLGNQIIEETVDGEKRISVIPGAKIINRTFDEVDAAENSLLSFDSLPSLLSFKYIFENHIIPKLKEGKYITVEEGKIVEKTDKVNELKANKFIQGLISGEDREIPLYRMNVDMLNYEQTPEGTMKMQNYISGLQALQGIDINGTPLSDWFILYNLYTNHDNYGTSRLTTLFDSFIDNSGQSSIIKDYLNYIGNLCYYGSAEYIGNNKILVNDGKDNTFTLDIKDLFMMSAVTVSDTFGKRDPVYRVAKDTGSVFEERIGKQYKVIKNVYFSGDTQEQTVSRQNIIDSYNTVGGMAQEEKILLMENLNKLDHNTIIAINSILADNFFELRKLNCR